VFSGPGTELVGDDGEQPRELGRMPAGAALGLDGLYVVALAMLISSAPPSTAGATETPGGLLPFWPGLSARTLLLGFRSSAGAPAEDQAGNARGLLRPTPEDSWRESFSAPAAGGCACVVQARAPEDGLRR
jgi:hypothetical protein